MTEREILKRLVEAWHQSANAPSTADWPKLFFEAGKLLADSEPAPEHPAVEAYRNWADVHNAIDCQMSSAFLAGWELALEWASREAGGMMRSMKWFQDASNATPERLP